MLFIAILCFKSSFAVKLSPEVFLLILDITYSGGKVWWNIYPKLAHVCERFSRPKIRNALGLCNLCSCAGFDPDIRSTIFRPYVGLYLETFPFREMQQC